MRLRILVVLVAVLAGAGSLCAAEFTEVPLRIPMAEAGSDGLEAVVVLPRGDGRHPLALLSHGSPRDAEARAGMSARGMMPQLIEFARRGFVAASVLRRGYGSSEGGWAETFGPCDAADYERAGRAGAADIRAAIAVLSRRPDVDASRIVAVGVSAGGFATVALTADPPPGLVAAISFAGGRGSRSADTVCDPDALVRAFRAFGARSRIPMLWVYAENDHFFGPSLARQFLGAFRDGGGKAEFVAPEAYGTDGHGLFSAGGRAIWTPIVDAFLARQGPLDRAKAEPETTEREAPAQEAGASLGGSGRVSSSALRPPRQLGSAGRTAFESYLGGAGHKAFAVTESGGYGWRTGRSTVEEASEAAIAACERFGKACDLYAVDDAYAR